LLLLTFAPGGALAFPQTAPQRDVLGALKRAITAANAPALTAQQETDLTTLITALKEAQPTEPDEALETAREALDAAILAGDLTAATTQATTIATRAAELKSASLLLEAKFAIDVLANLKTGGQYDALVQALSTDRLLGLINGLSGQGFGGGGGRGPRR
jgi:aconitase B